MIPSKIKFFSMLVKNYLKQDIEIIPRYAIWHNVLSIQLNTHMQFAQFKNTCNKNMKEK